MVPSTKQILICLSLQVLFQDNAHSSCVTFYLECLYSLTISSEATCLQSIMQPSSLVPHCHARRSG